MGSALFNQDYAARSGVIALWAVLVVYPVVAVLKLMGFMPWVVSWEGLLQLIVNHMLALIPSLMIWRNIGTRFVPAATLVAINAIMLLNSWVVPMIGSALLLIWLLPVIHSLLYVNPRITLLAWAVTSVFSHFSMQRGLAVLGLAAQPNVQISETLVAHQLVLAIVSLMLLFLSNQITVLFRMTIVAREREREAYVDGLTGIHNYKYFNQYCSRMHSQRTPYSLLMIDIDNFKKINDTHGHLAGDEVLRHLTRVCTSFLRLEGEAICRYGGEEFVAIIASPDTGYVLAKARQLRRAVADSVVEWSGAGGPTAIHFTVSIGVSHYDPLQGNDVFREADEAMYAAKRAGKNRVTLHPAQAGHLQVCAASLPTRH